MLNFDHIPIIDFHAHAPRKGTLSQFCEEGDESKEYFGKVGTHQTTLLRYAAVRYGCDPTLGDVDRMISQSIENLGFNGYVQSVLDRENVEKVNLDFFGAKQLKAPRPSIPGKDKRGKTQLEEDFPADSYVWTYGVTRIIQPIWAKEKGAKDIDQVVDLIKEDIDEAMRLDARALKSMMAYYRTLAIDIIKKSDANAAYKRLVQNEPEQYKVVWGAKIPVYENPELQNDFRTYQDFVTKEVCLLAAHYDCPMIFHVAAIDSVSTTLQNNDPANLHPFMVNEELKNTKIVILHAGYPDYRKAAVLPLQSYYTGSGNMYIDLSFMIFYPAAWRDALRTIIQFSPIDRILFGSDSFGYIERLGCSAWWGRRLLTDVLQEFATKYGWTEEACESAARMILNENARKILRLE